MTTSRVRRFLAAPAALLLAAATLTGCSGSEKELAEPTRPSTTAATTTTQETATEETTTTEASKEPVCDMAYLAEPGDWGDWEIDMCDGGFARVGVPQSDAVMYVEWDREAWTRLVGDGTHYSEMEGGMTDCFTEPYIDKLGVPSPLRDTLPKCNGRTAPAQPAPQQPAQNQAAGEIITITGLGEAYEEASYPACDGRSILILDSIIDRGNTGAAQGELAQWVMFVDPSGMDRKFTVPGQCPSLRAQVDGNNVYPVYLDFGQDTAAMCRAKATYGGNGRILSNRAEFVDPC